MIGATASFADERVRVAAYQCLVEVVLLYYEYLEPFMSDLFQVLATWRIERIEGWVVLVCFCLPSTTT
jgi:hypothetical protein